MHNTFRDPFPAEVRHLVQVDEVLQQHGPTGTDREAGLLLGDGRSICGQQYGRFTLQERCVDEYKKCESNEIIIALLIRSIAT